MVGDPAGQPAGADDGHGGGGGTESEGGRLDDAARDRAGGEPGPLERADPRRDGSTVAGAEDGGEVPVGRDTESASAETILTGLERVGREEPRGKGAAPTLGGNFRLEAAAPLPPADPGAEAGALLDLGGPDKSLTLRFLSPLRLERPEELQERGATFLNEDCFPTAHFLERLWARLFRFASGRFPTAEDRAGMPPLPPGLTAEPGHLLWLDLPVTGGPRKKPYTLGGVAGEVRLSGVPQEWLPLLVLGRHLHTGAGTAYGFGRYRIEGTATGFPEAFLPAASALELAARREVLAEAGPAQPWPPGGRENYYGALKPRKPLGRIGARQEHGQEAERPASSASARPFPRKKVGPNRYAMRRAHEPGRGGRGEPGRVSAFRANSLKSGSPPVSPGGAPHSAPAQESPRDRSFIHSIHHEESPPAHHPVPIAPRPGGVPPRENATRGLTLLTRWNPTQHPHPTPWHTPSSASEVELSMRVREASLSSGRDRISSQIRSSRGATEGSTWTDSRKSSRATPGPPGGFIAWSEAKQRRKDRSPPSRESSGPLPRRTGPGEPPR